MSLPKITRRKGTHVGLV